MYFKNNNTRFFNAYLLDKLQKVTVIEAYKAELFFRKFVFLVHA